MERLGDYSHYSVSLKLHVSFWSRRDWYPAKKEEEINTLNNVHTFLPHLWILLLFTLSKFIASTFCLTRQASCDRCCSPNHSPFLSSLTTGLHSPVSFALRCTCALDDGLWAGVPCANSLARENGSGWSSMLLLIPLAGCMQTQGTWMPMLTPMGQTPGALNHQLRKSCCRGGNNSFGMCVIQTETSIMFEPIYILGVFVKIIYMILTSTLVLQLNGHNNHYSFSSSECFILIGWFYSPIDSFRKTHNNNG